MPDDQPDYLISVDLKYADEKYNTSTQVNGDNSDDEIRAYFVDEFFDKGVFSKENMQQCIGVVIHR